MTKLEVTNLALKINPKINIGNLDVHLDKVGCMSLQVRKFTQAANENKVTGAD